MWGNAPIRRGRVSGKCMGAEGMFWKRKTTSVTPDPATLPPVSSIDAKAAYRARVGRLTRVVFFAFQYMPLTIVYWLMAGTAFVGETLECALITVGVVGDLLRFRFAPDLKVPLESWVDLYYDEWDAKAEHAFSRWYCGWEKPVIIGSSIYIVIFFLLDLLLPAGILTAYTALFAPLHDWMQAHLAIAGRHSADLIAHGYAQRIPFLIHVETVAALIMMSVPFLIGVGGNTWQILYLKKFYQTDKDANSYRESLKKTGKIEFFFMMKFSIIVIILATTMVLFQNISFDGCSARAYCPHIRSSGVLIFFFICPFATLFCLSQLLIARCSTFAFSVRVEQERLAVNGG